MLIDPSLSGSSDFSRFSPSTSVTAPLASGPSFLSGASGLASGLLSGLGSGGLGAITGLIGALGGGPSPATTPDQIANNAKQSVSAQFAAGFQVGGKNNSFDGRAAQTGAPGENTATSSFPPIDAEKMLILGVVAFGLFAAYKIASR